MPKFAANLSMLFTEHAFLDRFAAAKRAGFHGSRISLSLRISGKPTSPAHCMTRGSNKRSSICRPATGPSGERGIACLPDRVDEFRAGIPKAIAYARELGCTRLNALAGKLPPGIAAERRAPHARREPALRRGGTGTGRHRTRRRGDQHVRHPELLPLAFGAGVRAVRRGRLAESGVAVRRLSHAAHGRRTRRNAAREPRAHRSRASRR